MMMFKIRIWDKEKHTMFVPDYIVFHNGEPVVINDSEFDKKRFVVMFSTGIKDRNDIDIFEGDIVKVVRKSIMHPINIFGIVKYVPPEFVLTNCKVMYPDRTEKWKSTFLVDPKENVEVIGNVFQDKALLYQIEH